MRGEALVHKGRDWLCQKLENTALLEFKFLNSRSSMGQSTMF